MNIERLQRTFTEDCSLKLDELIVVGVSGGPDSLCLLDMLHRLGYPVFVAHFNHGLRPEAGQEAARVEALAHSLGLGCAIGSLDVGEFARQEKMSIEEAARTVRYRFLFDQARARGARMVAVAHNADDQVETVLMHLLRGAGLGGLRGMAYQSVLPEWDEEIPVVRPLLGVWREEILAYCADKGLDPAFDKTNEDTAYFRNRLRAELIPYLQTYNPRIREVIWRTAQTLEGDYKVVEQFVDDAWRWSFVGSEHGIVRLALSNLQLLGRGSKRNVLRRAIGVLRPNLRDIDYEAVERAVDFSTNPPQTGQMDLIGGLWLVLDGRYLLVCEGGEVEVGDDYPQLEDGCELLLEVPGQLRLGRTWMLECDLLVNNPLIPKGDPWQAWLDADRLEKVLVLRPRQDGDRFEPIGLDGHSIKISDFFINVRLTRRARQHYPLLCSAGRIAWIPGYRPANFCIVRDTTKRVARIRLTKIKK